MNLIKRNEVGTIGRIKDAMERHPSFVIGLVSIVFGLAFIPEVSGGARTLLIGGGVGMTMVDVLYPILSKVPNRKRKT